MKNKLRLAATTAVFAAFFIAGCSKKNDESLVPESDSGTNTATVMKGTTLKELGFNTVDEMIRQGWVLVDEFKKDKKTAMAITESVSNATAQEKKIPLTLDHLNQIGYKLENEGDRKAINELFIKDGIRPDGISLGSNVVIPGGVAGPGGKEQAYVTVGTPIVTVDQKGVEYPDEVYTTEAINNAASPGKIAVGYSYQSGYKTSWSRQVSGSFKVGASGEIGIPLVAEGKVSTEIMIGGATTDGTETSNAKTITSTYTADVPAKSKVTITILTKRKKTKVTYKVPMSITGTISANYYTTVAGHYFWIFDAKALLKTPKAEQGIVEAIENITTQVIASPAKKI